MRFLILFLCAAWPLHAQVERGVFHILSGGREIGTERFEIAPAGESTRATGELQITQPELGRVVEAATLVLNRGVEPARYERLQKSPKSGSVTVTFSGEKASAHYKTPEGQTQDMEFQVPKNVVILDTNFFHHYTFLVRQYDFLRGGQQEMKVLVPQEGLPGTVTIEYAGAEQSLRKLLVHTDQLDIQLWVDDAGRVMKLAVPSAKVEITREAR